MPSRSLVLTMPILPATQLVGGFQCVTPYDGIKAEAKSTLELVPFVSYSKGKTIALGKINVSLVESITSRTQKIVPRSCDLMWLYGKSSCVFNISGTA